MLTLDDLRNLLPEGQTRAVSINGQDVPVRGLTSAELAEVEAIFPDPIPPWTRVGDQRVRDEHDETYRAKADAQADKRMRLMAAIAVDLRIDGLGWTADGLSGTRPPASMRTGGPDKARLDYARAVQPHMERLGAGALHAIRVASREIESGKAGDPPSPTGAS